MKKKQHEHKNLRRPSNWKLDQSAFLYHSPATSNFIIFIKNAYIPHQLLLQFPLETKS